ncbi:MAG: hypothetical protein CM1200mP16_04010 [Nitrospina sp.]|nr:MAG: hypothetical protein CM1200mP16_04010 [Nitrospina sp.]
MEDGRIISRSASIKMIYYVGSAQKQNRHFFLPTRQIHSLFDRITDTFQEN